MEYVYELIDDNEGVIGIFTSKQKAIDAAIDDGWAGSKEDFEKDPHNLPSIYIEKIPLNMIYY